MIPIMMNLFPFLSIRMSLSSMRCYWSWILITCCHECFLKRVIFPSQTSQKLWLWIKNLFFHAIFHMRDLGLFPSIPMRSYSSTSLVYFFLQSLPQIIYSHRAISTKFWNQGSHWVAQGPKVIVLPSILDGTIYPRKSRLVFKLCCPYTK